MKHKQLMKRINDLESALDDALEWAEYVAGHNDFEESDTLQYCLWVLTQGEDGRDLK